MPQQVWKANDGSIFDSEEDCIIYEKADVVLRLFYDQNGKRLEEERPGLEEIVWDIKCDEYAARREIRAFVDSHDDLLSASECWDFWIYLGETLKRWRESTWHKHLIKSRGEDC